MVTSRTFAPRNVPAASGCVSFHVHVRTISTPMATATTGPRTMRRSGERFINCRVRTFRRVRKDPPYDVSAGPKGPALRVDCSDRRFDARDVARVAIPWRLADEALQKRQRLRRPVTV